jgi:8-oxo-dGTP pyrophosphatase MutT (NUDIX family)
MLRRRSTTPPVVLVMTSSAPQIIRVLAAVVVDKGRYLVCQRPLHKRHGGLWEFPGGKLEPGESLLDAANRELTEELNVSVVSVGEPIYSAHDEGSPFVIEFVPCEIRGEPACLEHADVCWATLEDIQHLDLAPSDRKFVRFLLDRR